MSDIQNKKLPIPCSCHCSTSYSIQSVENEFNENSPILSDLPNYRRNNVRIHDKIFLTILLLVLSVGTCAGLYLLAREGSNIQDFLGHEWKTSEVYNLTSRKVWQAHVPSSTMPKLKLPVTRVLFLQTNSSSCDSKSQCAKLVHELQLKHMSQWKEPDIVYNFLVSGDGSIFEGRGWNFQTTFSDYSSSKTVMIAFLGEFETNPPTLRQAESAKLFIDVAVMKGNLESCYNILILGENRFFIDMAQSIKQERFNCQN